MQVSRLEREEQERKQLAERQRWELQRLREEARRKDEFLAMLGHELRHPLAPLHMVAELSRKSGLSAEDIQWMGNIIDRQVQHLARLVDDLLDVSHVRQGKVKLQKETVGLDQIVERAVETCQPLIEARRHQLTVSLPGEPLWIDGDAMRLAQVVANLVNNAAKYTEERGNIWLRAEKQGAQVSLKVRDTGVGIAAEFLPHIFEPFMQGSRNLNRSQGGLGIGLALVRSLVELHGGTVQVHSEGPGQGTEFTVLLPAAPAPGPRAPPAGPNGQVVAVMPARRILVVDDNRDAADSLASVLGRLGHDVRAAYDGPSALEAAGRFRPEVVLSDIGLPGMDGYELARLLRAGPGAGKALLVAVTGYGQPHELRRCHEAGFDCHFVKPLLQDLQQLLARRLAQA
jgi:CheY-like chemotaxis protein/nitrogen-specific signal transduction histidine kinase